MRYACPFKAFPFSDVLTDHSSDGAEWLIRLVLLFVRCSSRCCISHHHPVIGPATDIGNPTLAVFAGRDGYPRPADRISLRE